MEPKEWVGLGTYVVGILALLVTLWLKRGDRISDLRKIKRDKLEEAYTLVVEISDIIAKLYLFATTLQPSARVDTEALYAQYSRLKMLVDFYLPSLQSTYLRYHSADSEFSAMLATLVETVNREKRPLMVVETKPLEEKARAVVDASIKFRMEMAEEMPNLI